MVPVSELPPKFLRRPARSVAVLRATKFRAMREQIPRRFVLGMTIGFRTGVVGSIDCLFEAGWCLRASSRLDPWEKAAHD